MIEKLYGDRRQGRRTYDIDAEAVALDVNVAPAA
jgi:hypothetical protein